MSTRVCFQWSRSCSRLAYLKTPVSMETSAKSHRGLRIDMWYKDIWSMMICKRDLTSFQRWPVQRLKISHIDANLQWFLGRGLDCACSEPRTCAHLCSIVSLMCCVHSNWSWCYSCVCVVIVCVIVFMCRLVADLLSSGASSSPAGRLETNEHSQEAQKLIRPLAEQSELSQWLWLWVKKLAALRMYWNGSRKTKLTDACGRLW